MRLPQVLQRTRSLSRSERWLATFTHLVPPVVAALPSRAAVSELVAELERGPVLEDRRPRELDDLRRGRTRRRTRRSLSAARHGERSVRTGMHTAGDSWLGIGSGRACGVGAEFSGHIRTNRSGGPQPAGKDTRGAAASARRRRSLSTSNSLSHPLCKTSLHPCDIQHATLTRGGSILRYYCTHRRHCPCTLARSQRLWCGEPAGLSPCLSCLGNAPSHSVPPLTRVSSTRARRPRDSRPAARLLRESALIKRWSLYAVGPTALHLQR